MSLTSKNQLLIAFKKLVGKAHTNAQIGSANEPVGSNVQIDNLTIFAQQIPSSPSSSLYSITNNIVEKVQFDVVSIDSSQYTAVGNASSIAADGDGAPVNTFTNGIHAFALKLPTNYTTLSSNPKKGTSFYINGQSLTGSNGALQIVPEKYGALYPAAVSSSTGILAPFDEEDYLLDSYSGILFVQDINRVPTSVTAYLYIGDYLTERVSSSVGEFTTITASFISASSYIGIPSANPGGNNTNIQFNSGSTFSGSNNLVYNYTNNTLSGTVAEFTSITGSHAGSGAGLTNIPNAGLVNSSVTVGSTSISLGSSATTIQGITVLTGSTVTGSTALFTTITASSISASSYIGIPSATPGGNNTSVQFNSGSTFSGSSNLIYNYTTNVLSGTVAQFTSVTASYTGSGAGLTNIPNSALVNNSVTIGTTVISLGGTSTQIQGLTNLTASTALFSGDIRVLGTASITQINTIGQQSLLVGDKYITILSGGVDHTGINGAGFLWGTSSGPGETTGALGEHAHILYDASRDALEIFPGLYVTGNTAFSGILNVSGATTLSTLSGTTAQFTVITASNINLSNNMVITGDLTVSSGQITTSATTLTVNAGTTIDFKDNTVISGNLNVTGSSTLRAVSGTTAQFTIVTGSTVTGSTAFFTSITGAHFGSGAGLTNIAASSINNISTIATTGVTAGDGLIGGGTTGSLTLNVGAGTGILVAADTVNIDTASVVTITGSQTITGAKTFSSATTFAAISGTTAQFTTITGSNINVSGNLVIFGTADLTSVPNYAYVRYTSSFDKVIVYPGLYVSGNLTASNDSYFQTVSGTIAQFTTITGSTVTGSTAQFITITASNDIIVNGVTVGEGAGNIVTNTVLGNAALRTNTTGIRNVAIGTSSLAANTVGFQNVAVGADTLTANISGSDNVAVGYFALNANLGTGSFGCYNIAVGSQTLRSNISGSYNIAIGANDGSAPPPLASNTTGNGNVAIGQMTLGSNVSGDFNVAVGREALKKNTASSNTAVGLQALLENTTGTQNCAVGAVALTTNSTGGSNSAFGRAALQLNTNGSNNTAVGLQSLNANTTGSFNTALGSQAGLNLNTGSNNLFLGYQAGLGETNLSNTVIIRANAERMRIDSAGNVGIATNAPTQTLDVNGTMRLRVLVAGTNAGFGRSTINGDITALTSDQRLKKEINTITGSLDSINKLRGVTYKWDDTRFSKFVIEETQREKVQIGLIAQEVETVLPELVYNNGVEDLKAVRYAELVAVLIEGIKELSQEVNNLKTEIQTLKSGSI